MSEKDSLCVKGVTRQSLPLKGNRKDECFCRREQGACSYLFSSEGEDFGGLKAKGGTLCMWSQDLKLVAHSILLASDRSQKWHHVS